MKEIKGNFMGHNLLSRRTQKLGVQSKGWFSLLGPHSVWLSHM
jgi:hypothetical protein